MFASKFRVVSGVLLLSLGLVASVPSFANDQEKAEKRVRQISAMAADPAARAIINRTMAEFVHAKRIELQRQRQAMNLSYGSLFIAHQLTADGAKMLDIALQLQSAKTIVGIANERKADWKVIADNAKRLEDKIEDNIYRHFQHPDADKPSPDEKYNVDTDLVRADLRVDEADLAEARKVYVFWRNRAAGPQGKSLDESTAMVVGRSEDTWDKGDRHQ